MATIVPNMTTLNTCDTTTGAQGNAAISDPDLKRQGTASIGFTVKSNVPEFGVSFTSTNMTGRHARVWMISINGPLLDIEANNGLQFYIEDSSARRKIWTIGGSDTYLGGWVNICIDPSSTATSTDTGWDITAITEFGFIMAFLVSPKNTTNSWIDYARYGDGISAYGATEFGIEEIYQADLANGYGVVEKYEGVYFLSGELELGDDVSTNACNYADAGETLVFTNKNVSSTLYKIIGVGNATGDTDIIFSNCAIKSAGPVFDIDMDDASIESFELDGCVIQGADQILLDTNCTITGSTFNACGEITPEAATIEDTTISDSTATNAYIYPALIADDNSIRITFIGNTNAIEISTDVDHTFDGHKFTGNTYDINNTSGATIIVYATNGSTASTYTGSTVDIQNSVTVTLTGVVVGSEISIVRTGTQTVEAYIANSVASGEFGYTFNSPPSGFTGVDIFVVKPGYKWEPIYNYTLPATSTTLPINQEFDRNYVT